MKKNKNKNQTTIIIGIIIIIVFIFIVSQNPQTTETNLKGFLLAILLPSTTCLWFLLAGLTGGMGIGVWYVLRFRKKK